MKRSTLGTLAILVILLAVWWQRGRSSTPDALPPLSVDGYIGPVTAEEARTRGQKEHMPFVRLELRRQLADGAAESIVLAKDSTTVAAAESGAPGPEVSWTGTRTLQPGAKAATVWRVHAFRATSIGELLQRSIRSNFAVRVNAKLLSDYGLDSKQAIDVSWEGPGRSAKLRVGLLQKADGAAPATTWVQDPGQSDIAYQIVDRDLRTSLAVSWDDLRDRRLLNLDLAAVDRLELVRPAEGSQTGVRIVATRAPLSQGATRAPGEGWSLVEPAGLRTGDVGAWLSAVGRLSASAFVATDSPEFARAGLTASSATHLRVGTGAQVVELVLGARDTAEANSEGWLQIAGQNEAFRVSSYAYDQVNLDVAQLRDRTLLQGRPTSEVHAVSLKSPSETLGLALREGEWRRSTAGAALDAKKISAFVEGLGSVKVDFVADAPPSAKLATPEWSVGLEVGDSKHLILLGHEENGTIYGELTVGKDRDFFKVSAGTARQIQKNASDFAAESPAPPSLSQ